MTADFVTIGVADIVGTIWGIGELEGVGDVGADSVVGADGVSPTAGECEREREERDRAYVCAILRRSARRWPSFADTLEVKDAGRLSLKNYS